MEDLLKKFQQNVIDEISKTRNFVSEELKVINEKIESLKIENAQTEQGMYSTKKMEDFLNELKQIVIAIEKMFETRNFFSGELKVISENIESLKDGKVESEEGMFDTKAMEDILKKLEQNVISEMSKTRSFVSRELKKINEKIEDLKVEKAETYLGTEFADLYAQESLIGEGSMGRVYRVRDRKTGKVCAMKSIGLDGNRLTPKVAREISTLFEIEHDNIVKLEKVHPCEGSLCLIMEYVGDNLSAYIQNEGILDANFAKVWLKELLLAVDFLHERDLIHCDLKPKNILIDPGLKLKVAGFGSVRRIFDDTMLSSVNTVAFKAPELLLGSNGYGKPIDIWAIGCIFAEMVEGKRLFGSEDVLDTEISILYEIFRKIGTPRQNSWLCSLSNFPRDLHQYPEASEIIPNLDAVGNDLIKKMLAVDPLERITAGDALRHPYIKAGDVSVDEIA
ncbi:cell division control protein 2 homolog A-like [Apium graveolens]|uniref:cell division control protein 2 homolog A-like n=1 Tax=Apium graveolens TaxID=4045 RepID=UPI003D7A8F3D